MNEKTDKLLIAGIELWLKVGCAERERAFAQRIELNVTLELPLAPAGKNDDLSKTIDYAAAVEGLRKLLTPKKFRLAEAVAEQAADYLLKKFKPRAVTVLIKKRALPGIDWAGMEIRRP